MSDSPFYYTIFTLVIPIIGFIYLLFFYFARKRKSLLGLSPSIFFILLVIIVSFIGATFLFKVNINSEFIAEIVRQPIIILAYLFMVLASGASQMFTIIPGFIIFVITHSARESGKRKLELSLLLSYLFIEGGIVIFEIISSAANK